MVAAIPVWMGVVHRMYAAVSMTRMTNLIRVSQPKTANLMTFAIPANTKDQKILVLMDFRRLTNVRALKMMLMNVLEARRMLTIVIP